MPADEVSWEGLAQETPVEYVAVAVAVPVPVPVPEERGAGISIGSNVKMGMNREGDWCALGSVEASILSVLDGIPETVKEEVEDAGEAMVEVERKEDLDSEVAEDAEDVGVDRGEDTGEDKSSKEREGESEEKEREKGSGGEARSVSEGASLVRDGVAGGQDDCDGSRAEQEVEEEARGVEATGSKKEEP
ncbi:hypothetical protein EDD11_000326 [Mortierella claussenii]|nr:hypothetical protein EDD11_000326 [Mortierella claussenii]